MPRVFGAGLPIGNAGVVALVPGIRRVICSSIPQCRTDLDERIREANSARFRVPISIHQDLIQRLIDTANSRSCVMCDQVWDSASSELDSFDLAKLELRLFSSNAMDSEAPLGIVNQSKMLSRLLYRDHILETGGVCSIRADFAVDADQALHDNSSNFAAIESILEAIIAVRRRAQKYGMHAPIPEKDNQGHAVAKLMRTKLVSVSGVCFVLVLFVYTQLMLLEHKRQKVCRGAMYAISRTIPWS